MKSQFKVGVVGYGYWGPNIVRNFNSVEDAEVVSICDKGPNAAKRASKNHPKIRIVSDPADIVKSPDIDIVAVVTPVSTHFELAKMALENGKHVFVEKPFTANSEEAKILIELAEKKNLKIMVDHTFLFTGAVKKIKELVDGDALGKLYYYDSTRVNLGLFQHDVNVIWDLAPHDLSIMDYVIKEKPIALSANGAKHFGLETEAIAYLSIYFESGLIAHFNVNWMSPVKIRTTLIGGEKKMLVWNDLNADEKIKVYDKGVNVESGENIYKLLINYRSGDIWSPYIDQIEALRGEAQYFLECIKENKTPVNDGNAGLRIVKLLELTNESLKNDGRMIKL